MTWPNKRDRRCEDLRELVQVVREIACTLSRISQLLEGGTPRLGVHIREVHGKESTMALLDPITLLNVERVKIAVAPLKADGTPDPTARITWASSDTTQVGVEPLPEHEGLDAEGLPITIPDGHEAWATTPLDSGEAEISISSPGYETDRLPISYEPGVPRRLNVSVGTPVPD